MSSGRVTFAELGIKLTALNFEEITVTEERALDFAVLLRESSSVQILLNLPSGKVNKRKAVKVGRDPSAMIVADIDLRGGPHIVVASNGANTVEYLSNNGQGGLRREGPVSVGASPTALAAGNLDGKAGPEVVVSSAAQSTVQVLNSVDLELIAGPIYPVGTAPSDVAIADIDGINGLDVLTVSPSTSTLTLLLNDGKGNLQPQPAIATVSGATAIATGELDGRPGRDVAVVGTSGNLQVLVNDGAGNLTGLPLIPTGAAPADVSIAEMDGVNGRDVIVRREGAIQVFLNNGSGALAPVPAVAAAGTSGLAVASLDEKPGADALSASPTLSLLQVFSNDGSGGMIEDRSISVTGSPTQFGFGNFDGG
jgi:hypothetical protein